ncbi:hypothetical protein K1719_029339 [Acacia pycnantha]|nr:hypothetical protein K1719_029339 [Acacia pycnantha]
MPCFSALTMRSSVFSLINARAMLIKLENMETPVVVLINLARIGWSEDGIPQVCSSFNPPIPEVKDLIEREKALLSTVLKIHYTVVDETGCASVIFWDKLASQLLDRSSSELKQLLKYRLLLKLKRNKFNRKHLAAGISVQQYTLCEDLTEQFNQASTDPETEKPPEATPDIDAPPQEESSVHLNPSNGSSTEPEILTLLQLSQNANPTAGKGKIKAPLKRTVGETTSSSATQTSSASIFRTAGC